MLSNYSKGDNLTILNTIYHAPKKNPQTNKYSSGSIDLIYKDNVTGEKKLEQIENPDYEYFMANEDVQIDHNLTHIETNLVHPIQCKYNEVKKSIAENTGNTEFFYDNIRNGNYRANDDLFTHNRVFRADMNVSDYYRYKFDSLYHNQPYALNNAYLDIEVDGIRQKGDFPEMGECPINAVTIVNDSNNTAYTLLLNNPDNPLIDEFKNEENISQQIKDFVRDAVGGWKNEVRYGLDKMDYKIIFYDEEIKLIHDVFVMINFFKPDLVLAWNMAFDIPYIIERIKVLGYAPEEILCHPDFKEKEAWYYVDTRADKFEERGDFAQISSYSVFLDQLVLFASRRKGQRMTLPSYKLDDVGKYIARVRKLDYSHITTKIPELPYKNYKVFVFYNIMDVIVQKCIEKKVMDTDFLFSKVLINNTRFSKAHRQTTYLANRGIKEFEEMGYTMGCNINKKNQKVGFPGAFVADPLLNSDKPKVKINGRAVPLYENLDDFDYKRLNCIAA